MSEKLRRNKEDIFKVIMLQASDKPMLISRLMQKCGLNYNSIKDRLDKLVTEECIRKIDKISNERKLPKNQYIKSYYLTTNKGRDLLR